MNPNSADVVVINRLEAGVWDEMPVHTDGEDRTESWVVALGEYCGGQLTDSDGQVVPAHGRWCPFDERRPHCLTRVERGKRLARGGRRLRRLLQANATWEVRFSAHMHL